LIKKDCGIDVLEYDKAKDLLKEIKKKKISLEDAEDLGYGNLVDALYKKVTRPKLIKPTFVIQHPIDTKPLSRKNDKNPRICDTFQLLVNTWEVINAYSEIVDPVDQRERFESQALAKAHGDEEAMMMNEEYLRTMEHGMPCASGFGIGIDRFVTLLTGQENLKDSVLFPLLRPLDDGGKKEEEEKK
jgi:lysyl-tRNA synthetase class 2